MREYREHFDGTIVDLDNPKTYERLPTDVRLLDDRMFKNIGMTWCYMNIWYPNIFGHPESDGGQKKRVMKMIKKFCKARREHYNDMLWLQEQVFLIEDETDNMC